MSNQKIHRVSLSATKLGDGLVDPKLVLSWLLTTLEAGAFWVGLLVPVREAGALLPQLFTAQWLRRFAIRKWWWVAGSLMQGVAVIMIILSVLRLAPDQIGGRVIFWLAVFALARSVCSVAYKDVLGKTVEKSKRGLVTGTAASIAAGGVLLFGVLLMFDLVDRFWLVMGALVLAGLLWLFGGMWFIKLDEEPSKVALHDKKSVFKQYLDYLMNDRELQKFLLARGLLTATAVAPPFLLLLAEANDIGVLDKIGALVVTAAFATFISGRIWGGLSDKSTKLVLGNAGLLSTVFLVFAVGGVGLGWYEYVWFLPIVLFGVMVSYQGVRIARSIHLVNLANEETRAAYTAISNTIIGVVLLGTGVFGWLAVLISPLFVVGALATLSFLGGVVSFALKQV